MNTYQLKLTDKGEQRMRFLDEKASRLYPKRLPDREIQEFGLLDAIHWGLDWPVWGLKSEILDGLLKEASVEVDPSSLSDLLLEVPQPGIRKSLEAYIQLGKEELPPSELNELGDLVHDWVKDLEMGRVSEEDDEIQVETLKALEEAETRSERVEAIDQAISLIHRARGWSESDRYKIPIRKILNKLRYE